MEDGHVPDGQEEVGPAEDPALLVWGESAARYDTVQVWMMHQF
jgi:hypothetical protein